MEKASTSKQQWAIEPDGDRECRIDNLKASCKVDFMFPVGDDLVIIDWKSGRPAEPDPEGLDKHARQMRGYMIWAHFQYEKDYSNIRPIVSYLMPEYRERELALTAGVIRRQTEEIWEYCADADRNIPLKKEAFAMTTNAQSCRFCNFRELCGPDAAV